MDNNTLETLAGHYGKRITQSPDGPGFEIPCPAHGGDKPTGLHVWESDDGRIAATCRTRECDYREIMAALETATGIPNINPRGWTYKATYQRADGPVDVWRHDLPGGGKEFPTAGSRDGIPIKVWGDLESGLPIIVCEGEDAARAVYHGGAVGVSYLGGSSCAGKADYSALAGRTVYVWPDNDTPGLKAAETTTSALLRAGAVSVAVMPPTGDEKGDAADVAAELLPDLIQQQITLAEPWTQPEPRRLVSFNIRDYLTMAEDKAVWQMPYIAPSGCISLLVGLPAAGKSTLFWATLSEGLQFGTILGEKIVPGLTVQVLTEERPTTFRRAIANVKLDAQLVLGQTAPPWIVTPRNYQDVNDWTEIVELLGNQWADDVAPDVLFVDPLGSWAGIPEWNSYGDGLRAIAPLQKLSASFQHTAIIASHHARKSGGGAVDAALGSVALTGAVDNIIALDAPDAADPTIRRLRYQGRVTPDDLDYAEKWIRWNAETGLYGGARKGAAHEHLIRECLADADNPLTTPEIIGAIPWPTDPPSESTISRCLRRMADADAVGSEGGTRGNPKRYWLKDNDDTC